MNLIFAGTPDFSVPTLHALHAAGHQISLVLTQPDRPAGRGMKLAGSAVKRAADELALPIFQPETLRNPEVQTRLAQTQPDAIIVVAYGLLLPAEVLAIPRFGCINVHASLLPRWRGAAPIHRAILAGDLKTGVSIMAMDAGLDTGPVYASREVPIGSEDNTASLHDRLAALGATALVEVLDDIESRSPVPTPQPAQGASYAPKISKEEAAIDWTLPAEAIHRQIRAFNPFPGAGTKLGQDALKIWEAEIAARPSAGERPGTVVDAADERLLVSCGEGVLGIQSLQRAGGRRLPTRDFLAGHPLALGTRFG